MSWPYHFVSLNEKEIIDRRQLLDRYGAISQLSSLVPVFAFQFYRLAVLISSRSRGPVAGYTKVPSAPGSNSGNKAKLSEIEVLRKKWRSLVWWLEGEVSPGWGLRGHWAAAWVWTSWLLFLVINETGVDYMHVTKRFGIVAAAQFPMHYMLSMKSLYSPIALAFQASHEQLNPYHRISGRIIYSFLVLHAAGYVNFFIQNDLLSRMTSLVPLLGAISISLLTILFTTSLDRVRRWSYRVFFVLHLFIALFLMPILFFHARPLRLYTAQSLALFFLDLIGRKIDTVMSFSKITSVPDTNLVKLTIPIPEYKIGRFDMVPGQHVYVSIPPESVPTKAPRPAIYNFLYNPFTVADVSSTEVSLVLRALDGPMTTALNHMTKLSKATPGINIEGPYGSARNFPNFAAEFDRILLVAGGIGATFILPIYHRIASSVTDDSYIGDRLEMIWVMKSLAETRWTEGEENANSVGGDDRVKIYVTGCQSESSVSTTIQDGGDSGSVEMETLRSTLHPTRVSGGYKRPNLRNIVDETFGHAAEERVAVLVCGPAEMARELRKHVGRWITESRDVWWHDESFGW